MARFDKAVARQWWVWTLTGTVLAGTAVALALGLDRYQREHPEEPGEQRDLSGKFPSLGL